MTPIRRALAVLAPFALVVLVVGCGDDEGPVASGDPLTGRTFLSEAITVDGAPFELVEGTRIRLELTDAEVRVNAGCNHLSGTLESTADGVLRIGQMGGTEMGCDQALHDQDDWLMELLTSSPAWSLAGDRLTLTSGSTVIELLDRRVADPDRTLEGTAWIVDTIYQGDTASSLPTDAVAELTFADGEVSGSTGCNDIQGRYRIDGSTLHVEDLVQTDVACAPEVMVLEDAVLALNGSAVTFEIAAARLTLTLPDGRGLGLHAADVEG